MVLKAFLHVNILLLERIDKGCSKLNCWPCLCCAGFQKLCEAFALKSFENITYAKVCHFYDGSEVQNRIKNKIKFEILVF